MKAHYHGDCAEFVIGQVMGPDTAGGYVVATSATYDGERTTVTFRPLAPAEITRIVIDPTGHTRLAESERVQ